MKNKILNLCIFWAANTFGNAHADTNCLIGTGWADENALLSGKIITLRQSLEDKNQADKAATFQWSHLAGENSSSSVDFGVGIVACEHSGVFSEDRQIYMSWKLTPKLEYHKNTLTSKTKDSSSAGLAWNIVLSKIKDPREMTDPSKVYPPSTDHAFDLILNYKNDRVKTGQGVQANITYSWTQFLGANLLQNRDGLIPYYWSPAFSIQGEQADGIQTKAGSVFRYKPAISIITFPFKSKLDKKVSIGFDYAGWRNFSRSGPYDNYDSYQDQKTISLNWNILFAPPDEKTGESVYSIIALGLDYKKGEQPEQGQENQEYTQLTFKLRL